MDAGGKNNTVKGKEVVTEPTNVEIVSKVAGDNEAEKFHKIWQR